MTPDFDEIIDRVGTGCSKWDGMKALYGVDPQDGIAMWVADMDFRPPAPVQRAIEDLAAHGVYGYPDAGAGYLNAIVWWLEQRYGWHIQPDWVLTAHGLVNGVGLCVDAFTRPGEGVAVMTPVYHAFARTILAADRALVELPLAEAGGRYQLDLAKWEGILPQNTRMLILCSPHNPGGRIWTPAELRQIADFCVAHDLILVSDEIHCDLTMPGQTHAVTALAAPDLQDRLITLMAATKTFNIAGAHTGNLIVADAGLRGRLAGRMMGLGISPGLFGLRMVEAAYSPEGAAWLDALRIYLDENRRLFDQGIAAIPGLRSMPLQATYLAWVDFAGTGMTPQQFAGRVQGDARIAANIGGTFGTGGETFMRFNLATPRARVAEAVTRLQAAFADLQ